MNSTVQALRAFILGLRRLWSIFSHIFTSPSRTADAGIRDILARFKELWPTLCFSKIEVRAVFTSSSNKKKLPTSLRSGRRASVAFKMAFSDAILKTVCTFIRISAVQFQTTAGGKVPLHSAR